MAFQVIVINTLMYKAPTNQNTYTDTAHIWVVRKKKMQLKVA